MSNLIDIFTEYSVDNLSNSASKIVVNPNDRTIWIAGMPYGNRFFPTNGDGIDTENLPNNSEVFNDLENNKALGDHSHAEGLYTQTTNVAEHACGKYNKSTEGKTIFSIGIGSSNGNRKNAIEVTNDDKVYISGIGNYNGSGEVKDVSTIINNILETLENGNIGGDITESVLPEGYKPSTETNENLSLDAGDNVVVAFSKLEKAIIDNEQVFTNATENIAYSVGLNNKLQYVPGEYLTAKSKSITESINILDKEINIINDRIDAGIGGGVIDLNPEKIILSKYVISPNTGESLNIAQSDNVLSAFEKLEKKVNDIKDINNKIVSEIGLNETLDYVANGSIITGSQTISEAIEKLDNKIIEIESESGGSTGSADLSNSRLTGYTISNETNENLSLGPSDKVVEAFGKLEKAIIDNEQVFTNATENIAYSVGLNESLRFTPPEGSSYASAKSISEAIEILDNTINSQSSGADYAEMFEWEDGNPDSEDRVGYFVELNGNKIIKSGSIENTIGVVSGTASVVSDNPLEWHNKYLKDKWGRYLKDDNGNIILNPEYDKTKEYQYRFFRKEWDAIGLIGKLFVRQDGTLSVGCKCKPSKNGIATISDDNTGYRVLEIIDDEVARILFK